MSEEGSATFKINLNILLKAHIWYINVKKKKNNTEFSLIVVINILYLYFIYSIYP